MCCPIKAEEGITGVLCPPNSSTSFRDLPKEQQIGGYIRPGQLTSGIDQTVLDSEGRCIILEFPAFVLIGVYCPANRDESRTDFRLAFIDALDIRVRNLVAEGKSVVVAGDLNIIRSEMDFANPMESLRKDGMTVDDFISMPARRVFNQLIFEGRVIGERDEGREKPILWDLCRAFHPQRQNMFTCWDTKKNARPGNYGSRIDYILCTDDIKPWLTDANIQEGLLGSDHCPVFAVLGDRVVKNGKEVDIRDLLNPPALFKDGKRLREWSQADLLPLSAKLIPEFDRRQSIRDMFSKNAAPKSKGPVHETEKNAAGETGAPEKSDESTKSTASSACPGPTPEPPAQTSGSKRPIAATAAATRPPKKSKGTAGKEAPAKPTPDPSQKTLAGFFKPAAATESPDKATAAPKGTPNDPKGVPRPGSSDVLPVLNHHKEPATPTKDTIPSSSKTESPEKVFDPIESKESWSKLLKKRVVPRCEHGEPCISLVTKKPGVNQGMHPIPVCNALLAAPDLMSTFHRTFIFHLPSASWAERREGTGN